MARRFDAGYYISEGFHSIFTHGFMSFAAVCMIVACLIIMGSFTLLAVNLDNMLGDLENENEMLVYIDDSLNEEQARALQPRLAQVDNVSQLTFVTREAALEDFRSKRESNADLLDDLPDDTLRDRYRVHVVDIERMAQTKEALAKLAEMYAAGVIDPEVFVRSDALEPVTAGRAGIFFGPWWCGYTVDSVTLDGSQEWAAYMAPLAGDGKFYSPMSDPTTQYVCVRKGYEHPEAAVQIINYLIAYEQDWINEGKIADTSTSAVYPLFNVYDNADEIEYSYEWLKKFNMGEVKKEDIDTTGRKLLKGDLDAIEVLKKDPKDDFSLEYWDLENEIADSNIPRLVSIMVGARPLMEEGYEPIYNAFSGQTDTMATKWANLQKLEEETFAKIILGQAPIDEFDNFVTKWYAEGGQEIVDEVTAAVNE